MPRKQNELPVAPHPGLRPPDDDEHAELRPGRALVDDAEKQAAAAFELDRRFAAVRCA
jgi:hypothetical protein